MYATVYRMGPSDPVECFTGGSKHSVLHFRGASFVVKRAKFDGDINVDHIAALVWANYGVSLEVVLEPICRPRDPFNPTSGRAVSPVLLHQQEFVMFRALEFAGLFPAVVDHCDSWYAVEFVEPLPYDHLGRDSRAAAGVALEMISFARRARIHGLLLCDVKLEHFGTDSQGRLRFIDGDHVFTEDALNRIVSVIFTFFVCRNVFAFL